jgi:hypothetical protein
VGAGESGLGVGRAPRVWPGLGPFAPYLGWEVMERGVPPAIGALALFRSRLLQSWAELGGGWAASSSPVSPSCSATPLFQSEHPPHTHTPPFPPCLFFLLLLAVTFVPFCSKLSQSQTWGGGKLSQELSVNNRECRCFQEAKERASCHPAGVEPWFSKSL